MRKKYWIILYALIAVLLLSGCSLYTVSELYCLPVRSEQYTNLQSVMNSAMSGMEYSAPVSGDNQQTVQSVDLDGDGVSEYLLFAKDSSDKPLKIFVFSGDGSHYSLLDTIESPGTSFDRVEYIKMDDAPGYEVVIGRKISDQVVRSMSVYTLHGGQMEQIMSANYTEFVCSDLDDDHKSDILVMHPGDGSSGVAVVYSISNGALVRSQEVTMSEPADNIMRIMSGKLDDGVAAVYVASSVSGSSGIITDIFAIKNGNLTNISLSSESGTSVQTLRNYYVYADDIDGDGILELPSLITMKQTQDSYDASSQYIICWYAMTSDGKKVPKRYTYHNYLGGWYVELDGSIAERFTVTQKGSSYEFSLWDETMTTAEKLMTVYALTGQRREEQAVAENRFILHRGDATIYSADLEMASAAYGMSKDSLIASFYLILEDWKTGET